MFDSAFSPLSPAVARFPATAVSDAGAGHPHREDALAGSRRSGRAEPAAGGPLGDALAQAIVATASLSGAGATVHGATQVLVGALGKALHAPPGLGPGGPGSPASPLARAGRAYGAWSSPAARVEALAARLAPSAAGMADASAPGRRATPADGVGTVDERRAAEAPDDAAPRPALVEDPRRFKPLIDAYASMQRAQGIEPAADPEAQRESLAKFLQRVAEALGRVEADGALDAERSAGALLQARA